MNSLHSQYRRNLWWTTLIFVAILLGAWLAYGIHNRMGMEERIHQQVLQEHRNSLIAGMDLAKALIESERQESVVKTEARLKGLVEQAILLVEHVSKVYEKDGPIAVRKAVVEALRTIRFDQGRGYFFITGIDGEEWLFPLRPDLEGKNMLQVADTQMADVVRAQQAIALSVGEGVHRYDWLKPKSSGARHKKIAYVKYYKPLKIVVGTGLYEDDILQITQERIISQLSKMRYGPDAYFFAATWQGISLMGPGQGKSMLDVEDINGIPVVKRLIELSKSGGGFLEYHMPAATGQGPTPKLSYVLGIPEWQWYIGIGKNIYDLEDDQDQRSKLASRDQVFTFVLFVIFVLLSAFVSTWISRRMSQKVSEQIQSFVKYFHSRGSDNDVIPEPQVVFDEFKPIATAANQMIATRQKLEEERERLLLSITEKNRELERVLHIASHDLRTPLVTIQGFSTELASDVERLSALSNTLDQPESIRQVKDLASNSIPDEARFIRNAVLRMDTMIQGILRYSRAGRIQPNIRPLDLNTTVTETIQSMQYLIQETHTEISTENMPRCLADAGLLVQVLSNIIENALKYSSPDRSPIIRIHGHYEGPWAVLCIEDNGIGISDDNIGKVFDLFSRINPSKDIPGEGLGLALASRLMLRMDGRIWVESKLGVGSRFCLALPGILAN